MSACDAEGPISPSKLPKPSTSFVEQHFPDCKIIKAEYGRYVMGDTYEVDLDCGVEIDFYKKGEWKLVDCHINAVPEAIVPQAIKKYVADNYSANIITSIDKERTGYEIELNDDLDLDFDHEGNFIRIDRD